MKIKEDRWFFVSFFLMQASRKRAFKNAQKPTYPQDAPVYGRFKKLPARTKIVFYEVSPKSGLWLLGFNESSQVSESST